MGKIELMSPYYIVCGPNKSRAETLRELEEGDIFFFKYQMQDPGRNGNQLYASYFTFINVTKGIGREIAQSILIRSLEMIPFRQCDKDRFYCITTKEGVSIRLATTHRED
jgi:hypothetical protein